MRDLVYYVATSLDGFIAGPGGDFSAFPQHPATLRALFDRYPETCPTHLREVLGLADVTRRFDTVLMGYRTYEPACSAGMPGGAYPHLQQVVATHRQLAEAPGLSTIRGDLTTAVDALKRQEGQDIWLCGGADIASQVIDQIDEIQTKVNPIALGSGIPLLSATTGLRGYHLAAAEELPAGVILLTYRAP